MPEADPPEPASSQAAPEPRTVIIGVISAPGTSTELAERLRPDLTERIGARLPGVRWVVRFVSRSTCRRASGSFPAHLRARRRLIDEQWHLTVCVTDLPLQTARRPVVAHASMTHGVAVLSLPALGAVGVTRRAADALVRLVAALVGDADRANLDAHPTTGTRGRAHADVQRRRGAVTRRLQELGDAVAPDSHGFGLVAGVITGNLRLLLGMLRANRPWRLAIRLSRAWWPRYGGGIRPCHERHLASCRRARADPPGPAHGRLRRRCGTHDRPRRGSVGTPAAHRLGPEQVIMFNLVTLATVVIGVLALYGTLLVLNLVGAFLLVPRQSLADALGHKASVASMAGLAWLATSVATVGGALGAGLETDEAVREAAYGYQADAELSR